MHRSLNLQRQTCSGECDWAPTASLKARRNLHRISRSATRPKSREVQVAEETSTASPAAMRTPYAKTGKQPHTSV
jgi:hypothetical protein